MELLGYELTLYVGQDINVARVIVGEADEISVSTDRIWEGATNI